MIEKILELFAYSVVRAQKGDGYWKTAADQWIRPKNPLPDLEVGQTVYTYDEDDTELQEERVCAVHEGIGYLFRFTPYYGPDLCAVTIDSHAKSVSEAVALFRESIESDIKYYEEKAKNSVDLRKLLAAD
jgi:hypothetical protein